MLLWVSIGKKNVFITRCCSELTRGEEYVLQKEACGELRLVSVGASIITTSTEVVCKV